MNKELIEGQIKEKINNSELDRDELIYLFNLINQAYKVAYSGPVITHNAEALEKYIATEFSISVTEFNDKVKALLYHSLFSYMKNKLGESKQARA